MVQLFVDQYDLFVKAEHDSLSAENLLAHPLKKYGLKKQTPMQKGAIRVQTETIFPIIKNFLYSDHEIFLRELVRNAVDASQT